MRASSRPGAFGVSVRAAESYNHDPGHRVWSARATTGAGRW
jgi:hypothetical protein